MASKKHRRVSITVATILLILLVVVLLVGQSDAVSGTARRQRSAEQISKCGEIASASECSQRPKCRWCHSELLDDMCFSYSEAWRLPQQVFSCVL